MAMMMLWLCAGDVGGWVSDRAGLITEAEDSGGHQQDGCSCTALLGLCTQGTPNPSTMSARELHYDAWHSLSAVSRQRGQSEAIMHAACLIRLEMLYACYVLSSPVLSPLCQTPRQHHSPQLWAHMGHIQSLPSFLLTDACGLQTSLGDLADYNGSHHAKHSLLTEPENYERIESGLVWLGVAGLQDPPRAEVKGAMERCAQAGIRVTASPCGTDADFRLPAALILGWSGCLLMRWTCICLSGLDLVVMLSCSNRRISSVLLGNSACVGMLLKFACWRACA